MIFTGSALAQNAATPPPATPAYGLGLRSCGRHSFHAVRSQRCARNRERGAGAGAQANAAPLPPITAPFRIHVIAQNIAGGYALLAVDLNKDGKTDIVAL